MTAGYSGTPLPKKLGIQSGHRVALLGATAGFDMDLPEGATLHSGLRGNKPFDVVLLFVMRALELHKRFGPAARRLQQNGGLWICWPKKASGLQTDVGDAIVRKYGLQQGLVDNKVCAVDETWSGLRFVIRLRDRT